MALSTKLRKVVTATQAETLLTKNKNQSESIEVLTAALKAKAEEAATLRNAVDLLKEQIRNGNPDLRKAVDRAQQEVADLTDENNSLRSQLQTVSAKLES